MEQNQKLEPEFKTKWIKALRSGDYKQGNKIGGGHLYNENSNTYCCIGVAGAICGIDTDELKKYFYAQSKDIFNNSLPKILIGVPDNNIIVKILTFKNDGDDDVDVNPDGKKYTFNEIADYIEENL
jgi:hypothetical protein